MKKLMLILALMAACGMVSAQSYTQKWNSLYERTEFYDSYGRLVGYSKYNKLYDRLEYFNASGTLIKTESYNTFTTGPRQRAATATSNRPGTTTLSMTVRISRTGTVMSLAIANGIRYTTDTMSSTPTVLLSDTTNGMICMTGGSITNNNSLWLVHKMLLIKKQKG